MLNAMQIRHITEISNILLQVKLAKLFLIIYSITKNSIYDTTSVCYHAAIPYIVFAIENYQNFLFSKGNKKNWKLTLYSTKLDLTK